MTSWVRGTIYLLHFHRPYKHAKHYLGIAEKLDARLAQHRAGQGARLLAVITEAGIGFDLARTWEGDRAKERRLKGRGLSPLCPICRATRRGEQPPTVH